MRLRSVAQALGADLSGEAGAVLMQRYAEMAEHYRDTWYLHDLGASEGEVVIRLTARGIVEAKEEG